MRIRNLTIVLGLALLIGCPDGNPKGDLPALHPTKGKVVRGGQAVSGGSVRFQAEPDNSDIVVSAEVDAKGTFELQTTHAQSYKKGSGAPAGTYQVTYFPALGDQTAGANPAPVEVRDKVMIKEGANELTIEIGKKK